MLCQRIGIVSYDGVMLTSREVQQVEIFDSRGYDILDKIRDKIRPSLAKPSHDGVMNVFVE